jgi:hypothetical protein
VTADADADPALAEQARRLALAAELTHRAARRAADVPTAGAGRADATDPLVALALRLAGIEAPVARAHRLRFAPPYPGATGGVEETAGGRRLVLACTALDARGRAVAVIFTTLIAGRAPQVAAAPPGATVPPDWRALDLA